VAADGKAEKVRTSWASLKPGDPLLWRHCLHLWPTWDSAFAVLHLLCCTAEHAHTCLSPNCDNLCECSGAACYGGSCRGVGPGLKLQVPRAWRPGAGSTEASHCMRSGAGLRDSSQQSCGGHTCSTYLRESASKGCVLIRQEHKEDAKAETEVRAEDDKTVVPIVADKAGDEAEPAEAEVPLTAAEGAPAPRLGGMPAGALQARQGKALVSHLLAAVGADRRTSAHSPTMYIPCQQSPRKGGGRGWGRLGAQPERARPRRAEAEEKEAAEGGAEPTAEEAAAEAAEEAPAVEEVEVVEEEEEEEEEAPDEDVLKKDDEDFDARARPPPCLCACARAKRCVGGCCRRAGSRRGVCCGAAVSLERAQRGDRTMPASFSHAWEALEQWG